MKHYKAITCYLLLFFPLLGSSQLNTTGNFGKQGSFSVSLSLDTSMRVDTIFLFMKAGFFDTSEGVVYISTMDIDSIYRFHIDAERNEGEFQLMYNIPEANTDLYGSNFKYFPLFPYNRWRDKDSVHIHVKHRWPGNRLTGIWHYDFNFSLSGKGSLKYIAKYRADTTFVRGNFAYNPNSFDTLSCQYIDLYQEKMEKALGILNEYKPFLPVRDYDLLRMDVVTFRAKSRFTSLWMFYHNLLVYRDDSSRLRFKASFAKYTSNVNNLLAGISLSNRARSKELIDYTLGRINFEHLLNTGVADQEVIFREIISKYTGVFRDKLLVTFFLQQKGSQGIAQRYDKVLAIVKDRECLATLKDLRGRIPGFPVYVSSLPDTSGHAVKLTDFKGMTVFVDFWSTGCGACSGYYKSVLKQAKTQLAAHGNIVFVSISMDRGKDFWLKSIRSGEYTSDDGDVINLYTNGEGSNNELIRYYKIDLIPQFMIIRPDGNIHKFYENRLSEEISNTDALVKTLLSFSSN